MKPTTFIHNVLRADTHDCFLNMLATSSFRRVAKRLCHTLFGQLIDLYKRANRMGGKSMRTQTDDIRKRIARRKKERDRLKKNSDHVLWTEDEERYGFEKISSYESRGDEGLHPLFNREWFLFKVLASACLFLVVAIMFKNNATVFEPARNFVKASMEKEFQFTAVSNWYEEQFGKPLALLPIKSEKEDENKLTSSDSEYALPASARILEDFSKNGQRITIETNKDAAVEAMSEGLVIFAGKKGDFGKTVIIQHTDKSESWYGNLADIHVGLYKYVEKGSHIGTSTAMEDGMRGTFFFAIKNGEEFIDPSKVIPFD